MGFGWLLLFCGWQQKSLRPYKCKPWPPQRNAAKWYNSCDQAALHRRVGAFLKHASTFTPPLPPNPLAGLPPYGAPLAKGQRLQENFDNLCELERNMLGNVEKMKTRVGDLERKV